MRSLGPNRLSLGLFGANCSGGLACSTFPDRWVASWDNLLALARQADAAGLDFMLPLGRWIGYGGATNHNGSNFETLTWATGLLASTRRINVFGTVHVTAFNPVVAAKQMVTADHVGRGRFGLNIVCGWYQKEFDMLGVDLGGHDRRYDLGQEWVDILTRAWTSERPFDYAGEFYKVKGTYLEPKPFLPERPILVSAGMSGTGRAFALRNADMLFTVMHDFTRLPVEVAALKRDAAALGRRDIGVFTNVAVVCRPTEKEARDYHHFYAVEHADHGAVETMVVERGMDKMDLPEAVKANFRLRAASGNGAFPIVGTPDQVADVMRRMSEAGVAALAVGLPNYLKELPYLRAELLPRLAKSGLRVALD